MIKKQSFYYGLIMIYKKQTKKYLKQCSGRHTKTNKKANQKLKKIFLEKGITNCEGCGIKFGLTFAHRKKRYLYYKDPKKLYDINEVLLLCLVCHQKIEADKKLIEEIFELLRPSI